MEVRSSLEIFVNPGMGEIWSVLVFSPLVFCIALAHLGVVTVSDRLARVVESARLQGSIPCGKARPLLGSPHNPGRTAPGSAKGSVR